MGLSSIATTGIASPAVKAGVDTVNKLKKGASVADIKNEAKEKIGNDVDTFKKTVKTAAGVGVAAGVTVGVTQTGVASFAAGKIANLIPDSAKTKIAGALQTVTTSGVGKKVITHATKLLGGAKAFATAHPVATAVLAGIGLIGTAAIEKVKENGAKNEGKIEQKYADILDLKNAAAKDLG